MHVDLAVIVLNYRTLDLTRDCLASLATEVEPGIRVVVVDNASGDGSGERLASLVLERGWSDWATVLQSPVNGGFGAGNNFGIRSIHADAYVLLNSDTLVRPGALKSLREAMRLHPEAGIVGAGLVNVAGDQDYNAFRVPTPISEFIRAARTGPLTRMLRRHDPILPLTQEPFEPGWVGFACVLIRREVVDSVGLLDDDFFMYFEDLDYCVRATRAGWKILYWPAARIVHIHGASSGVTRDENWRHRAPRYYYESRARYFAKRYGRRGLWLANCLFHLGRLVAAPRELLGRSTELRDKEGLDIWINAGRPLQSRKESPSGEPPPSHDAPLPRGDRNLNPQGLGLVALVIEDYRTHDRKLLEPGFLAIAVHRFGNARMDIRSRFLRALPTALYRLMYTAVDWFWGIDLEYTVRLGRRVRIWHHGGMVIGARAIGDDVHLRHNTTFGVLSRTDLGGKPIIGKRVDIGAGACILGPVTVGDDAVIGANTVVIRDVRPGAVMMGVPARQASLTLHGSSSSDKPGVQE